MLVNHFFYKNLVKHKVTKIMDILFWIQKYIQIEDMTRTSRFPNKGSEGEKVKSQLAALKKSQNWAFGAINKKSPRSQAKANREEEEFTPFKISADHVFSAIKDQPWIRRPRLLPPNPKGPGAEEYCAFHNGLGHRIIDCRYLWK